MYLSESSFDIKNCTQFFNGVLLINHQEGCCSGHFVVSEDQRGLLSKPPTSHTHTKIYSLHMSGLGELEQLTPWVVPEPWSTQKPPGACLCRLVSLPAHHPPTEPTTGVIIKWFIFSVREKSALTSTILFIVTNFLSISAELTTTSLKELFLIFIIMRASLSGDSCHVRKMIYQRLSCYPTTVNIN